MTDSRLTIENGCYVEGGWGWKGSAHLIDQFSDNDTYLRLARAYQRGWTIANLPEAIAEIADEVVDELNDALPDGQYAQWHDGEFFISVEVLSEPISLVADLPHHAVLRARRGLRQRGVLMPMFIIREYNADVFDEEDVDQTGLGEVMGDTPEILTKAQRFTLWDDDDTWYFQGYADIGSEDAEGLDGLYWAWEWGIAYAGAVWLTEGWQKTLDRSKVVFS